MADPAEPSGSLWDEVKSFFSNPWPEDDSTEVEALADGWRAAGEALQVARADIGAMGSSVRQAWPDPVGFRLAHLLEQYARDLEAAALNIGWLEARTRAYAQEVYAAKASILLEFGLMLIPFNYALNPIFGILGKLVARQIAQSLARSISTIIGQRAASIAAGGAQGLAKLTRAPAREAAQEIANDVGTQMLTMNRGLRESYDRHSTERAALGGAMAAPLAGGLNRLVGPAARGLDNVGVPKPIVQGGTGAVVNAATSPAGSQVGNSLHEGFTTGDYSGLTDAEGYTESYREGTVISGVTGGVHGAGHQAAHDIGERSGLAQAERDFALRRGWIEAPGAGAADGTAGAASEQGGNPPSGAAASPSNGTQPASPTGTEAGGTMPADSSGTSSATAPPANAPTESGVPGSATSGVTPPGTAPSDVGGGTAGSAPPSTGVADGAPGGSSSGGATGDATAGNTPSTPTSSGAGSTTTAGPGSGAPVAPDGSAGSSVPDGSTAPDGSPGGSTASDGSTGSGSPEGGVDTSPTTTETASDPTSNSSTDTGVPPTESQQPSGESTDPTTDSSSTADRGPLAVDSADTRAEGVGQDGASASGSTADGGVDSGAPPIAGAAGAATAAGQGHTSVPGATGHGSGGSTGVTPGHTLSGPAAPSSGVASNHADPGKPTTGSRHGDETRHNDESDAPSEESDATAATPSVTPVTPVPPSTSTASAPPARSAEADRSPGESDQDGADGDSEAEASGEVRSGDSAEAPSGAAAAMARTEPAPMPEKTDASNAEPTHTLAQPVTSDGPASDPAASETQEPSRPPTSPVERVSEADGHVPVPADVTTRAGIGDPNFDQSALDALTTALNAREDGGDLTAQAQALRQQYYSAPHRRENSAAIIVARKHADARFTVGGPDGRIVKLPLPKLGYDPESGDVHARTAPIPGVRVGVPKRIPLDELPVGDDIQQLLERRVHDWETGGRHEGEELGEIYAEAFAATLVAEHPGSDFLRLNDLPLHNGRFDLVLARVENDRIVEFHIIEAKAPRARPGPRLGRSGRSYLQGHPENVRGVIAALGSKGRPAKLSRFVVDDEGIRLWGGEHLDSAALSPIPSTFVANAMLAALESGDLRFHLVTPTVTRGGAADLKVTEYLMDPGLDSTGVAADSTPRTSSESTQDGEHRRSPDPAAVLDYVERALTLESVRVHVAEAAGVRAVNRSGPGQYVVHTADGHPVAVSVRTGPAEHGDLAWSEPARPDGTVVVVVSDLATDDTVLDGLVRTIAEVAQARDRPVEPSRVEGAPYAGSHRSDAEFTRRAAARHRRELNHAREQERRLEAGRSVNDGSDLLAADDDRLSDRMKVQFATRLPGPVMIAGLMGAATATPVLDGAGALMMAPAGILVAATLAVAHARLGHRIAGQEKLLKIESDRRKKLDRRHAHFERILDPTDAPSEPTAQADGGAAAVRTPSTEDLRGLRAPLGSRWTKSVVPGAIGGGIVGVAHALGMPLSIAVPMTVRLGVTAVLTPPAEHFARLAALRADHRSTGAVDAEVAALRQQAERELVAELAPRVERLTGIQEKARAGRDEAKPGQDTSNRRDTLAGEGATTAAHHASTPVDRVGAELVRHVQNEPAAITEALGGGLGRSVLAIAVETITGAQFAEKQQQRKQDADRHEALSTLDAELAHQRAAVEAFLALVDERIAQVEQALGANAGDPVQPPPSPDRVAARREGSSVSSRGPFDTAPSPEDRGPQPLPVNDLSDYIRRGWWRFTAAAAGSETLHLAIGSPLVSATVLMVGAGEVPAAFVEWKLARRKALRQQKERDAEIRTELAERNAEFDRRTRFAIEVVDAFVDAKLAELGHSETPAGTQQSRHRSLTGRGDPLVPPTDDPQFAERVRSEAERVRAELIDTVVDRGLGRVLDFGATAAALDAVIEAATVVSQQQVGADRAAFESARDSMFNAIEDAGPLLPGFVDAIPSSPIPPTAGPDAASSAPRWSPVPPRAYTGPPEPERAAPGPVAMPVVSPEDFEVPALPTRPPDLSPEPACDAPKPDLGSTPPRPPVPEPCAAAPVQPPRPPQGASEAGCLSQERPEVADDCATPDPVPWNEICPPTGSDIQIGMPICFSVLPQSLVFALLPEIERLLTEELAACLPPGEAPESGFHCRTLCAALAFLRHAIPLVPGDLCIVAHYASADADGGLTVLSRIVWPV